MTGAVLKVENLCKSFGALPVSDAVNLEVKSGEIHAIIGPNGAGKSTLIGQVAGGLSPDTGSIFLNGQDITGLKMAHRAQLGLGRTFQIPRPFARMSVLENVMLAPLNQIGERLDGPFLFHRAMNLQESDIRKRAMEVLEFMMLAELADHPAGKISGGQMKLLELARLLMGDPQIILLDEPAAGINPMLAGTLIKKIEELNQLGKTFVIIEHDMDFIMHHCDPIIALAQGSLVFEGNAEEAQSDKALIKAYLGTSTDD